MNLKYLLDTNIISEAIRPIPNPNVIQSLITHQSSLAIGSVVWHEVLVGCYRMPESKRRQVHIDRQTSARTTNRSSSNPYDHFKKGTGSSI
jgi:predicted nucleic acid-binding protein